MNEIKIGLKFRLKFFKSYKFFNLSMKFSSKKIKGVSNNLKQMSIEEDNKEKISLYLKQQDNEKIKSLNQEQKDNQEIIMKMNLDREKYVEYDKSFFIEQFVIPRGLKFVSVFNSLFLVFQGINMLYIIPLHQIFWVTIITNIDSKFNRLIEALFSIYDQFRRRVFIKIIS